MSTSKLRFLPAFALVAFLLATQSGFADSRAITVIPFQYEVPNISNGIADVLTSEISAGHLVATGRKSLEGKCRELGIEPSDLGPGCSPEEYRMFAGYTDYMLVGEITAFAISDKDQAIDLSDELNDLGRLVGQGSESAHIAMDISLISTADGEALAHWLIEGIESRDGIRMKTLTYGWMGAVDVKSDEFRETMIGHATYKALGNVILNLYELFPVEGEVLAVSGDAVVLNIDGTSGLEIGDEITIVHRRVITNSDGVVAWKDDEPVGRVEVIEFQPGRCLCMVLEGSGGITEGDIAIPVISRMILPQYADVPDE